MIFFRGRGIGASICTVTVMCSANLQRRFWTSLIGGWLLSFSFSTDAFNACLPCSLGRRNQALPKDLESPVQPVNIKNLIVLDNA